MSEEHYCQKCDKAVSSRDLLTKYSGTETGACRTCGTILFTRAPFGWSDNAAMIAEDVASLSEWLDKVAEAVNVRVVTDREREDMGEFHWTLETADEPWFCQCSYLKGIRGGGQLALWSGPSQNVMQPDAIHQGVMANMEEAKRIAAVHGVFLRWSTGSCNRWGVAIPLVNFGLTTEHFKPMLARLVSAMNDLVTRFSNAGN